MSETISKHVYDCIFWHTADIVGAKTNRIAIVWWILQIWVNNGYCGVMWLVLISVSIGIFDDILIPADAMQHPSRLYPFVMINGSHVKFSSTSGLKASREEVFLSGILSSWRIFWRRKDVDESARVWLVNRRKTCNT